MAAATPSSCKVVLANAIAKNLLKEVTEGQKALGREPLLVGFLSNTDPAARMYADWTGRTCTENGFQFDLRTVDKEDLEEAIIAANQDHAVDGIIVYYPIFGGNRDGYLQQVVDPSKDVEGLGHQYVSNMYKNIRFLDADKRQKSILPCTPLAIVKILDYIGVYNATLDYGNRLFGRTITVINRSEVVGRPLAALLANDGACVYSVDKAREDNPAVQKYTRGSGLKKQKHEVMDMTGWELKDCLPISDVVISGVPGHEYKIPAEKLRDGAVCINFSSEKNFNPDVKDKAAIYVPAIGKVTIVVLLRNLLRLVQNKQGSMKETAPVAEPATK